MCIFDWKVLDYHAECRCFDVVLLGHFNIATIIFFAALGQVMLYIDGMEGVIKHNDTVRWLYSLIASDVSIDANLYICLLTSSHCSIGVDDDMS